MDAGKLPRLVTEEESTLLISIIEKIIKVAKFIITNKFELESVTPEYMFCFSEKEGKIRPKEIKWPTLKYEFIKQNKLEEDLINKMAWIKNEKELNIGMFYAPMFIEDTKTYPLMVMIHNEKEDVLIHVTVIKENEENNIANIILESLIEKKVMPSKISFNSNEITDICKDIIKEFEILFRVNENMVSLFNIWINMYENLS